MSKGENGKAGVYASAKMVQARCHFFRVVTRLDQPMQRRPRICNDVNLRFIEKRKPQLIFFAHNIHIILSVFYRLSLSSPSTLVSHEPSPLISHRDYAYHPWAVQASANILSQPIKVMKTREREASMARRCRVNGHSLVAFPTVVKN